MKCDQNAGELIDPDQGKGACSFASLSKHDLSATSCGKLISNNDNYVIMSLLLKSGQLQEQIDKKNLIEKQDGNRKNSKAISEMISINVFPHTNLCKFKLL